MFLIILSILTIVNMKEHYPSVVTPLFSSHSQPKTICHKQFFKTYCPVTLATTPITFKLFLIVYCGSHSRSQPRVPSNIPTRKAPQRKYHDRLLEPRDRLTSLKAHHRIRLEPHMFQQVISLDHQGTSKREHQEFKASNSLGSTRIAFYRL